MTAIFLIKARPPCLGSEQLLCQLRALCQLTHKGKRFSQGARWNAR
jgi:hypothetical protein